MVRGLAFRDRRHHRGRQPRPRMRRPRLPRDLRRRRHRLPGQATPVLARRARPRMTTDERPVPARTRGRRAPTLGQAGKAVTEPWQSPRRHGTQAGKAVRRSRPRRNGLGGAMNSRHGLRRGGRRQAIRAPRAPRSGQHSRRRPAAAASDSVPDSAPCAAGGAPSLRSTGIVTKTASSSASALAVQFNVRRRLEQLVRIQGTDRRLRPGARISPE